MNISLRVPVVPSVMVSGRYKRSLVTFVAMPLVLAACIPAKAAAPDAAPFAIQVVDEATGRGVPLVELRTTNDVRFVTDSAGYAAVDNVDLLGRAVFFHVNSHGYEFPIDGFGNRGAAFDLQPGGEATLKIRRINIAERLYRVTGGGIYADSVRLDREVPLREPLLCGGVTGQDSVQAAILDDKAYWFWGDTNRLRYPLGHFGTSVAYSTLPAAGGVAASLGIDLTYFVDEKGFSRPSFPRGGPVLTWVDGVTVLKDPQGRERILAHYSRRESLQKELEHGVARFDVESGLFTILKTFPLDAPLFPQGQSFRVRDREGREWICFATALPQVRTPATWDGFLDPEQYEGFTPLRVGSAFDERTPDIEMVDGRAVWGWKRGSGIFSPQQEQRLMKQGKLAAGDVRWARTDAATGELVQFHNGSIRWNEFRKKWITIAVQTFGKPSFLGEVWYAEAESPEGPWGPAVRVLTHDRYSFYNPVQHAFLDEDGGRTIYFEGTYATTFSREGPGTPRYDYNGIMYRLDLSDPRLEPARRPAMDEN